MVGLLLSLVAATAISDENTLRMESAVVDSFDGPGSCVYPDDGQPVVWNVVGSQFAHEGYPKLAYAPHTWPIDLFGRRPDNEDQLQALGVHAKFDRVGYNTIEIVPGEGDGESWVPKPIGLPGRVQMIDFWAWGAEYNYTIELRVRDYAGRDYRLVPIRMEDPRAGNSLEFTGWKNMYVEIPGYIRQSYQYVPQFQKLSLTKIIIYTHPEERVDDFYFYLDHMKVLSDFQETYFDGFELTDPDRVQEIWGTQDEE